MFHLPSRSGPVPVLVRLGHLGLLLFIGSTCIPVLVSHAGRAAPAHRPARKTKSPPASVPSARTTTARTMAAPASHPTRPAPKAEELAVQGERRPLNFEKEQHRPAAAVYLSPDELITRNVHTVSDLGKVAPGLQIQSSTGGSNTNFRLRGVGLMDFTGNNTPMVMTYVDGVAFPSTVMTGAQFFDLDGISVTPGPQGWDYGQTSVGGNVSIRTADPTSSFHAGFDEEIASYWHDRTALYVSGPLARGLTFRLAGMTQQGGGYTFSRYDGSTLGNADMGALRAKLFWDPDEKTHVGLTGRWSQDNSQNVGDYIVGLESPAYASLFAVGRDVNRTGWGASQTWANFVGLPGKDVKPFRDNTAWGVDLNMSRVIGPVRISSLSAYNALYRHEYMDWDSTSLGLQETYQNDNTSTFTQQVGIAASRPARLDWGAGLYYNRNITNENFNYDYIDMPGRGYIGQTRYIQTMNTLNAYAHASYRVTGRFGIDFGITHESDSRRLEDLTSGNWYFNPPHNTMTRFPTSGLLSTQFAGGVTLHYQLQQNWLGYVSVKRGFQPGGFTANSTVSATQLKPYKAPTLWAFELGSKFETGDHRYRLNADFFYYLFKDQVFQGFYVDPSKGYLVLYQNAPDSHMWGIETQFEAHPIPHLTLSQRFAYMRAYFDVMQTVNQTATTAQFARTNIWSPIYQSANGQDQGTPKVTLNGMADYAIPLSKRYDLDIEADYSYSDPYKQTGAYAPDQTQIPAYFIANAGITFRPRSRRWYVSAYSSNIANRHYDITRATGIVEYFAVPAPPRFCGARFGMSW